MRTLALRGGERAAVDAAEWSDAFGVVTRGRVQLELRDGEPGPVLGRDAGFWLRGTGVRALRNPGRRTARVRIITPRHATCRSAHPCAGHRTMEDDMNSTNDTAGTVAGAAPARIGHTRRLLAVAAAVMIPTLAWGLRTRSG
ncbi:hypothetical protein [Spirillospora sp. NPDC048824]|uniref:hypothetical protein n=1 Tax=Spirillospora sp. NPDC048824 TaxID=3364526 RepID=UPI00371EAEE5